MQVELICDYYLHLPILNCCIAHHFSQPGERITAVHCVHYACLLSLWTSISSRLQTTVSPSKSVPNYLTMSNPRIEEVSDSDPEIDDPSDFLPNEIMRPADMPSTAQREPVSQASAFPTRQPQQQPRREPTEAEIRAKRAELKPYTTLSPIYFYSTLIATNTRWKTVQTAYLSTPFPKRRSSSNTWTTPCSPT